VLLLSRVVGCGMARTCQEVDMSHKTVRIFGGLDFLFGWLYLLIFIYAVPSFDPTVRILTYVGSIAIIVAGAVMLAGGRVGYWVGVGVAGFLLLLCFALVAMLVAAAAYLYGLYGAFGKGATYVTLFGISLVVAYIGLLPIFQMAYLLRREVRTSYRRATGEA